MRRKTCRKIFVPELSLWPFPSRFPWDMRRLPVFRRYTVCMDRCFRSCCLHCFRLHHSSFFGVDAAPAALIGGALIDLHIESGSEAALKVVPVPDSVCGRVASGILSDESGKTRELHICTGDGRFYYRNLHDDYSHAGTETVWRDCGHWRTFGAGRTYRKYTWTDPCSVTYNGCDCTGNSAGGKRN